ncbi:MAG: sigma-70 family RNA polymerase sigma factor [Acidobacteria bacterium]|nr:sigma-70 family RNA polymerase sigma factor [Acidobacteriota bacterium]
MNDVRTQTDEQLVRAARRGDAEAYDRLVRRYMRPAMALAWQYTHSVPDAEDVVQEAFHRLVRALDRFDDARSFKTWFYTILRNVARTSVGRDRRRSALAPLTVLEEEPPAPTTLEPGDVRDVVRALEDLSPMQQASIRLCDVEGYTSGEAATMLGVSEGTVRTHLHRGRGRLRTAAHDQQGILP